MNLGSSNGQLHQYENGTIWTIGQSSYRHDMRGRVVEKRVIKNGFRPKTWHYLWDDFDRLTETHTPDGAIWRYTYDAFGRRFRKECVKPGEFGRKHSITYVWQGATLTEEWKTNTDGENQPIEVSRWHFEPGTFNPIAKETRKYENESTTDQFYPIVTDHLGTPKELFDTNGNCVWQAEHELWGRTEVAAKKSDNYLPIVDCSLRFQNQWADKETGLYYNLNRYYDPDSGQYLSADPIGLKGGLRTHGYVHDPMQWVDPMGLAGCMLGQNMPDRVTPAAKKMGVGWLKASPSRKWTWRRNENFLNINMNDSKLGKGHIYDIGGERGRYQGPKAIYSQEKGVLKNNGFERVNTGKQITVDNGKKFRLYEWIYTGK